VRRNTNAKLIYRAHNIEHQVWQRLAMQKNDPIKRFFLKKIAARIKKYELLHLNSFDAIAVFTRQDKQTMEDYGANVNIEVIPVGIAMERYCPEPEKTEFPSLFFLGSLNWMPNREGIEWFLENFHNHLVNGELRVRFYVAGNDIPEQFDEYEVMGKIYIQGEVDDALEFVNSKSIMIVPLLSGGGMRVKIVEGMAMQKCIISTSLGAEGIQYTDGHDILIANTREEFFDAIKRCIADEDYCKTIGQNARRMIETQHDLHALSVRMGQFYQQVAGR
jgi:glycosyltransferase involved in cell wall biosynthesis